MFQALIDLVEQSTRQLREAGVQLAQAGSAADMPHPTLLPMQHANAYHDVVGRMARRQLELQQGLAMALLSPRPDLGLVAEIIQLQQAALNRMATVQTESMAKLGELAASASGIRQANTMSKLMDQEYDLLAGLGAIMQAQSTAMVELMESLQIGFGYLVAQRLEK